MSENLQFAQTFSNQGEIPLLTDLFGCFTVEPFFKEVDELAAMSLEKAKAEKKKEMSTQTDRLPPPRALLVSFDMNFEISRNCRNTLFCQKK